MKKSILITGASGFIGRNLKEKLSAAYDIYCPVREELDLLHEDVVMDYIRLHHFDVVIHAANTNNTRNKNIAAYNLLDNNLRMYFNLARCKEHFGKMYYFGSGAEYDREHYIPNMREEYFDTYIPKEPYGFSKYIMAKMCGQTDNIYDLRLFGVYGRYEEWERRFISNAICRALKGKDITLQRNIYFDYLWIDDLCDIMQWFIEREPQNKHYNVCRGSKIDLFSLACMVREILDIDCDILVKETGWKPEYTGSNERLLTEMGTYPFTGYKESIQELCDYYKANIGVIDESKLV